MSPDQETTQFGPYRVLGVLGRGGMGQVLRAHDAEHQRDVALKLLPAQWAADEHYRERFRREAQIAARLNEPHVVPIHRYGEIDGQLFLDMRLVEGEDLGSLLARTGPLDPARATDLVGQVGRALDAAHAGGLVHRDVKPSNVLLVGRADGGDLAGSVPGEDFAYLADFGIARVADEGTGPGLTGTGLAIGSTEYMAPERFTRDALDGRADVYSLACVFFELLTGRRPFAPGDPMGLMYAHLHEEPPAPSSLRPGLPAALDAVVLRGLAKERDRRWPTAGAMAAAARQALAGSGVPVPRPDGERTAVTPLAWEADRPATRQQPAAGAPPTVVGAGAVAPGPPAARRGSRLPWVLVALMTAAALALAVLAVVLDRRADSAEDDLEAAADRLIGLALPGDVTPADCTVEEPGDGELRRLSCPDGSPDVPLSAITYTAWASGAADEGPADAVAGEELPELDTVSDCGDDFSPGDQPEGWLQFTDSAGEPVGRLACYVDESNDAVLVWSWDDLGVRGEVSVRDGGVEGVNDIASWWSSNADRGL